MRGLLIARRVSPIGIKAHMTATPERLINKRHINQESVMSLMGLLLIVLVVMFITAIPAWPHSRS